MAAHSRAGGWARMAAALAVVLALDQITKQIAISAVDRGESVNVFLGLDITNTRNTGIAFGALQGRGAIVAVLVGVALTALVAYFAANAQRPWLWLPAGMLLGGALGNLLDRIREGAVIDFVDPIAWPAFNFADACIVVGVAVLLYVAEARPGEPGREPDQGAEPAAAGGDPDRR
ncbi:MAG: signal peptidase II [Solirubrobacterales bacterium]|nr:signal peptidase II [Solirubrobacterales bacterium]